MSRGVLVSQLGTHAWTKGRQKDLKACVPSYFVFGDAESGGDI